ncbi:sialic acid-binding Ig-like lectin 13 [Leuresthes tenuis]|uniref:sialic acid-binding Ig-like lectin 13 n=1 Tax=Leuresthes tenuis TaxID=355514 RepID=UPI003B513A0A
MTAAHTAIFSFYLQFGPQGDKMGASEWPLFFMCIWFRVIETEASTWTASVPNSVKGLLGSCVVIPCNYDYPQKAVTEFTGIWMYNDSHVIFHPEKNKIQQDYRGRTSLLGDVSNRTCSLKIDPLRRNDTDPFFFRIEIKDHDKYSYKEAKVSISMISEPNPIRFALTEDLKENQSVSASCSVTHSCPFSPPDITWSHSGEKDLKSQNLTDGQWNITSTLTFRPTHMDHNKSLRCNVTYKGGKRQTESKILNVKYAPKIKTESSCSSDGNLVTCECIVDSTPPSIVSFVLANKVLLGTKRDKTSSFTISAPQADFEYSLFVDCVANNTEGNANLRLPLPLSEKMLLIFIAVGAGGILMILLIAVGVYKKWGRSGDSTAPNMGTMMAQRDLEFPPCSTSKKETYDDTPCDPIYANSNMYGNIGDDWDGAIYGNV